jgi:transposase
LQAIAALLTGAYRLSKRQGESLQEDAAGVHLCAGHVCALEQQTGAALSPVVVELQQELRRHSVNMDETSWREGKSRPWLWVGVTTYWTVYHVVASRGADVVTELLGADYAHVLTSDRFKAYYRPRRCPDRYRDSMRTRTWLGRQVEEWLLPEIRLLLQRGTACGCAKTAGTCIEILKVEESLWTFAHVEGVEPTNNVAERALRHPVLWRTVSHGTRSPEGSRFVTTILSVVETCRQQGRHLLEYPTACCQAALANAQTPSLLPQPGS